MHPIEGGGNQGGSQRGFLLKLWRIVNDEKTNDLIYWSESGQSFIIRNQAVFTHELLPIYFKHNNIASFIRQLNMYGFHKVISPDSGGLRLERDEMEFAHPYFVEGCEHLMGNIRRKIAVSKGIQGIGLDSNAKTVKTVNDIVHDIKSLKGGQKSITEKFDAMKRENEMLWREYATMRQRFNKQQQIIEKLIRFLVSMVPKGKTIGPTYSNRPTNHLALEAGDNISNVEELPRGADNTVGKSKVMASSGPIIHELTPMDNNRVKLGNVVPAEKQLNQTGNKSMNNIRLATRKISKKDFGKKKFAEAYSFGKSVTSSPIKSSIVQASKPTPTITPMSKVSDSKLLGESFTFNANTKADQSTKGIPVIRIPQNDYVDANSYAVVQSPNGSIIGSAIEVQPQVESRLHDSVPTSHDILQIVNPSSQTPNVLSVGKTIGSEMRKNMKDSGRIIPYKGNYLQGPIDKPSFSPSSSSPSENWGEGEQQLSLVPRMSNESAETRESNMLNVPSTSSNPTGVGNVVLEESDEIQSKMEEMQSSIDSIQELFGQGTFSVDPSMLLSLFGENDFDVLPNNNGKISGSELSLYNPGFSEQTSSSNQVEESLITPPLDTIAEDEVEIDDLPNFIGEAASNMDLADNKISTIDLDQINPVLTSLTDEFVELPSFKSPSPRKKLKLTIQKRYPDPDNDGLNTPQPSPTMFGKTGRKF